jgi:hypothetical protein
MRVWRETEQQTEVEVFFVNLCCRIKPFNDDGNDATTATTKDRLL